MRVSTSERAVLAVRGALVSAARAGRTASAGEVSSAAYGAWVPRGLGRLLAEVSRGCRDRGEPDLVALVEHRLWLQRGGPRDAEPADELGHELADERSACWRRWGAPETTSPPPSAAGPEPATRGAFGERGVLCPECLTVAAPGGGCSCRAPSHVGTRFSR